jgi:hypothetical protein
MNITSPLIVCSNAVNRDSCGGFGRVVSLASRQVACPAHARCQQISEKRPVPGSVVPPKQAASS